METKKKWPYTYFREVLNLGEKILIIETDYKKLKGKTEVQSKKKRIDDLIKEWKERK